MQLLLNLVTAIQLNADASNVDYELVSDGSVIIVDRLIIQLRSLVFLKLLVGCYEWRLNLPKRFAVYCSRFVPK